MPRPGILAIAALWGVALFYLVNIGLTWWGYHARVDAGYFPPLLEFTPTYGASLLLQALPTEQLYLREPMTEYTIAALHSMYANAQAVWDDWVRYPPWLYPPHFILLVMPLAALPFWWALIGWNLVTAIPYLAAMTRILPPRLGWPLALALPPVFYNLLQGQTGFLTAGLIALGLHYVPRQPLLAGLFIGLASIKPHFGLLIPLALLAAGHYRAFGAATLTLLALVGISLLLLGPAPWVAFFTHAAANLQGFENATYSFIPMTTPLSATVMAGGTMDTARFIQFAALLIALLVVAWVWWRGQALPHSQGLQNAVLCITTVLAVPMAYIYDLVLLAPAIGWLVMDLIRHPSRAWEWGLLIGAGAGLSVIIAIASRFGVQIGPALVAALLAVALHRFRIALKRPFKPEQAPIYGN